MKRTILLLTILAMFAISLTGCDNSREAAKKHRNLINEHMEQAKEASLGYEPEVSDEEIDEACEGISEAEIERVEEKMEDLSGELVVLDGEEMEILRCSRLRKE